MRASRMPSAMGSTCARALQGRALRRSRASAGDLGQRRPRRRVRLPSSLRVSAGALAQAQLAFAPREVRFGVGRLAVAGEIRRGVALGVEVRIERDGSSGSFGGRSSSRRPGSRARARTALRPQRRKRSRSRAISPRRDCNCSQLPVDGREPPPQPAFEPNARTRLDGRASPLPPATGRLGEDRQQLRRRLCSSSAYCRQRRRGARASRLAVAVERGPEPRCEVVELASPRPSNQSASPGKPEPLAGGFEPEGDCGRARQEREVAERAPFAKRPALPARRARRRPGRAAPLRQRRGSIGPADLDAAALDFRPARTSWRRRRWCRP